MVLLWALVFNVYAEDFQFTWEPNHPNDGVVTYRMYVRMDTGDYDQVNVVSIGVDDIDFDAIRPSVTLSLPESDQGYCFALTAVDSDNFESDFSEEVGTGITCGQNSAKVQNIYPESLSNDSDASGSDNSSGCYINVLE